MVASRAALGPCSTGRSSPRARKTRRNRGASGCRARMARSAQPVGELAAGCGESPQWMKYGTIPSARDFVGSVMVHARTDPSGLCRLRCWTSPRSTPSSGGGSNHRGQIFGPCNPGSKPGPGQRVQAERPSGRSGKTGIRAEELQVHARPEGDQRVAGPPRLVLTAYGGAHAQAPFDLHDGSVEIRGRVNQVVEHRKQRLHPQWALPTSAATASANATAFPRAFSTRGPFIPTTSQRRGSG